MPIINFEQKYFNFHKLACRVTYAEATHTGPASYDGMDPSGRYTECPFPFTVKDPMTIEADINKEYACSDHFFVISSSSSYRPWIWGSETNVVKVVWNCNDLYIYGPSGNVSALSFSVTIHHLKIEYSHSYVRVTTDVDNVDLSLNGTYWPDVWVWMGADDDLSYGSDFANVTTDTCDLGTIIVFICFIFVSFLHSNIS